MADSEAVQDPAVMTQLAESRVLQRTNMQKNQNTSPFALSPSGAVHRLGRQPRGATPESNVLGGRSYLQAWREKSLRYDCH